MRRRWMVVPALIAIVFGAMVCRPVNAQELDGKVLYCVEDKSTGFDFDRKTQKYEHQAFKPERFMLKFEGNKVNIKSDSERICDCTWSSEYTFGKTVSTCNCGTGYYFTFNKTRNRFLIVRGFGYVFMDGDSVMVSIGKCSDF